MQLSNKEKNLLFVLALVTVCVVCLRFVLLPILEKNSDLKVQLEQAEQNQHEVQMRLSKLNTIDEEVEKVLEETMIATEPFFTVVETEYLHKWAVKVAQQANLQVQSLAIGGKNISAVSPYSIENSNQSYPIGDFYHNMVNSTTTEDPSIEQVQGMSGNGKDAVVQMPIQLNVKGTKSQLIQFATNMASMDKHVVLQGLDLQNFDKDEERDVTLSMVLYGIHKEDDGVLNYQF